MPWKGSKTKKGSLQRCRKFSKLKRKVFNDVEGIKRRKELLSTELNGIK